MKILVNFSRIFVGVLFIISGFIKLNDPIGFSFKLEEYFGPTVLDLPFFMPYALLISVSVVILEVILGVFLLIGYKPKFTVYSLMAMIGFFTFLTFYSAFYNKVTDCGCFGDALKLTPWESFSKDVVLSVFIMVLFFGLKYIKPIFNKLGLTAVSLFSFCICLGFAYHVLMHLPSIDFRPYNIGANIIENMTVPDDAQKDVIDYHWTFKVNGEDQVITTRGGYPDVDGEYVGVETEVVTVGYEAPIHDFTMEIDGEDMTLDLMEESKLVMIVMYSLDKAEADGLTKLNKLYNDANSKGYKVIAITASGDNEINKVKTEYNYNFDFYFCDETALKTIVRSTPGILTIEKGTITDKVHWNDIEDLQL
ncbi:MAG: DoxX family protein [Bacteroidetes bacterium MedPE-SWsnd-G2]|nr:MAG: DoxX family protein [Bacteroidetes bacterium MedPE-SWsnd-G2]